MSLFDLSDIVADLSSYSVSVLRRATTVYLNGVALPAAWSTVATGVASVQPLGKNLAHDAEGDRESDRRTVYTALAIRNKDKLIIAGEAFEVEAVSDWSASGQFFEATVRRLAPGEV